MTARSSSEWANDTAPSASLTTSPCWPCFKLIANSGCVRIVFGEFYRDPRIFEFASRLSIELVALAGDSRPATSRAVSRSFGPEYAAMTRLLHLPAPARALEPAAA